MPPNTVSVTRPGKWGNFFKVGVWFSKLAPDWYVASFGNSPHFGKEQVRDLEHSLELWREYAACRVKWAPQWLEPLRDKDLACWCKEGAPCHANILLELANDLR